MIIDWFTVGAQTVNFLILVWLLKRFLYQPILDAIDAREQRIADELDHADKKQRAAEQERDQFHQKNVEIEQQRGALLRDATTAADNERLRLFALARQQADALSANRHAAIQREQQNLNAELRRLSCSEVFAITRKTLNDLAGVSLEQSMTEMFLKRLKTMADPAKQTFADALAMSEGVPVRLRSAFALLPKQQTAIQAALNNIFSVEIALHYELAPEIISGIELNANGQKLAWSVAEYLTSLENKLTELLATNDPAASQVATSTALNEPAELITPIISESSSTVAGPQILPDQCHE